jgi:hypothetical protein
VTIIPKKKKEKQKKGAKFGNITNYESFFFLKKKGKGGPSILLAT